MAVYGINLFPFQYIFFVGILFVQMLMYRKRVYRPIIDKTATDLKDQLPYFF